MYFSSQNLTDSWLHKSKSKSKLWHGRAWLRRDSCNHIAPGLHWEWALGRYATSCALKLEFGHGDSDAGVQFHVGIPFLFNFFVDLSNVYSCKGCETGIAIHNEAFWIYPLSWTDEWKSNDPWWRKSHAFYFPWSYDWYKTEVLTHDGGTVVWEDSTGDRRSIDCPLNKWGIRREKEVSVTIRYPYRYVLESGEIQDVFADVFVDRTTWKAKWYSLIPLKKVSTCININFVNNRGDPAEVGERTGSWKGGTTGCSYEMLQGETPEQCLRRMERERKF